MSQYEEALLEKPWQEARLGVDVKLLPQDKGLYIQARSHDRIAKERSMRRRQLKKLCHFYLQITHVEEAFRNLKGDLGIRPMYHHLEGRVEDHIFICFLASTPGERSWPLRTVNLTLSR